MKRRAMSARTITVIGMLVGLMLSGAGPAAAEKFARTDPRGDVHRLSLDPHSVDPKPDRRLGDVTRTIVRHTKRTIVLRTNYARLHHRRGTAFEVWWWVEKDSLLTQVVLSAGPGDLKGSLAVDDFDTSLLRDANGCFEHKVSYRKNFVRIVLMRSCLIGPRPWIKVATSTDFHTDDPDVLFTDDGLTPHYLDLKQRSRKIWRGPRP